MCSVSWRLVRCTRNQTVVRDSVCLCKAVRRWPRGGSPDDLPDRSPQTASRAWPRGGSAICVRARSPVSSARLVSGLNSRTHDRNSSNCPVKHSSGYSSGSVSRCSSHFLFGRVPCAARSGHAANFPNPRLDATRRMVEESEVE